MPRPLPIKGCATRYRPARGCLCARCTHYRLYHRQWSRDQIRLDGPYRRKQHRSWKRWERANRLAKLIYRQLLHLSVVDA